MRYSPSAAFVRRDQYNYYPSANPFSDLGPIQQETVNQDRTLANAGLRSDISWVKGIHNLKAGATYQQTFLDENTRLRGRRSRRSTLPV